MTQQFEKTHCPGCGTKIEYPADYRGDTTPCPGCNQPITLIPANTTTSKIKTLKNKSLAAVTILLILVCFILAWNKLKTPPNHKELRKHLIHLKATIQHPHTITQVAKAKTELYELYLSHSNWDSVQVDILSEIDHLLGQTLFAYNENLPTFARDFTKTIVVDIDLYLSGDAYKLTDVVNKAIKSGKDPTEAVEKFINVNKTLHN